MPKARRCKFCRCTERRACAGGCRWVLPDVCSTCAKEQLLAAGIDYGDRADLPMGLCGRLVLSLHTSLQALAGEGSVLEAIAEVENTIDDWRIAAQYGDAPDANTLMMAVQRSEAARQPELPPLWRPGMPM